MKALFAAVLLFLSPVPVLASWHFNENAGFGIYQPEGWSARIEGRSSRLRGPSVDSNQSDFFLGSDWISRVRTVEDLRIYLRTQFPNQELSPEEISGLAGFRIGDQEHGTIHVLRVPENVIVISFDLRGSRAQKNEGQTMLGSINIRVRPIEN